MLTRVGIETALEALQPSVFFTRASQGGPNNTPGVQLHSGRLERAARARIRARWCRWSTPSTASKGTGTANRGRYSNPEVDHLSAEALQTNDDAKRAALLAKATEIAIEDVALHPLHYQVNTWAARKGLKLQGALGRVHAWRRRLRAVKRSYRGLSPVSSQPHTLERAARWIPATSAGMT